MIDSILDSPSLRNQILNAATKAFEGFVTGYGLEYNTLRAHLPEEMTNAGTAFDDAIKARTDNSALSLKKSAEDEIVERVISKILNTQIGAYFIKDILEADSVLQLSKSGLETSEGSFVKGKGLGRIFKVLAEKENFSMSPEMIGGSIPAEEGTMNNAGGVLLQEADDINMTFLTVGSPSYEPASVKKMTANINTSERIKEEVNPKDKSSEPSKFVGKASIRSLGHVNNRLRTPTKDQPNLVGIVIKDPKYSFPTRNQQYLSVFFNAVSQVEMSRCVPIIETTFFKVIGSNSTPSLDPFSHFRFEKKGSMFESMTSAGKNSSATNPLSPVLQGTLSKSDVERFNLETHEKLALNFMDVFQSPQTMVNGNINNTNAGISLDAAGFDFDSIDRTKTVLNPFAPMLSLQSLTVTVAEGNYYMVSGRKASMTFIIHDRSRLRDFAAFVTPGGLQKTAVKITFGWSHPEGGPTSDNDIGKFLNCMRETSFYRLSSANLRIEGSKVMLDMKLDFMAGTDFKTLDIAEADTISMRNFHEVFNAAFDELIPKENSKKMKGFFHPNLLIVKKAVNSMTSLVKTEYNSIIHKLLRDLTTGTENKVYTERIFSDSPVTSQTQYTKKVAQDIIMTMFVAIGLFEPDEVMQNDFKSLIKKIKDKDLSKKRLGSYARDSILENKRIFERIDAIVGRGQIGFVGSAESSTDLEGNTDSVDKYREHLKLKYGPSFKETIAATGRDLRGGTSAADHRAAMNAGSLSDPGKPEGLGSVSSYTGYTPESEELAVSEKSIHEEPDEEDEEIAVNSSDLEYTGPGSNKPNHDLLKKAADSENFFTPDYFSSSSTLHRLAEKENPSRGHIAYNLALFDDNKNELTNKVKNEFVTLGKLLMNLIGVPISTKPRYNEIQFVFYPVNNAAAALRSYTTASLPIHIPTFISKIEEHIEDNIRLTPKTIFTILSKMLQDDTYIGYGMQGTLLAADKDLEDLYNYSFDEKENEINMNKPGRDLAISAYLNDFVEKNGKTKLRSDLSSSEIQAAYRNFVGSFRNKDVKDTLDAIYMNDGLSAETTSGFTLVHLHLDKAVHQVLDPNFVFSDTNLFDMLTGESNPFMTGADPASIPGDANILRIHVYDQNASPKSEYNMISKSFQNVEQFLDVKGNMKEVKALAIKNSTGEVEKFDKLTKRKLVEGEASQLINNMSPSILKQFIKREYPSITYGAMSSVVKSINLSSTTDNEIAIGKSYQAIQDQQNGDFSRYYKQTELDVNVIPSSVDVQVIGCPFFKIGTHIYIDGGTDTDLDNVYAINSVTHTLKAGEYTSSVNLIVPNMGSTSNLRQKLSNSLRVLGEKIDAETLEGIENPTEKVITFL